MKQLDARIRKIRKDIDASFTYTRPDGTTHVNTTCSQGRMVSVHYFDLQALLEFYEETKKAASAVIIAREALAHAYWSKKPLPYKDQG